jgi:hypothetical protein
MSIKYEPFITNDGSHFKEVKDQRRLRKAHTQVANSYRTLAECIYKEDAYAEHVPQEAKELNRVAMLDYADDIESGAIPDLAVEQRINTALTGVEVPLYPKGGV